jgi:hypothetical protein
MTDKPKPPSKSDDPAESQRFIDMALEVETDETPEAFDRAFKKVIPTTPLPPKDWSASNVSDPK